MGGTGSGRRRHVRGQGRVGGGTGGLAVSGRGAAGGDGWESRGTSAHDGSAGGLDVSPWDLAPLARAR